MKTMTINELLLSATLETSALTCDVCESIVCGENKEWVYPHEGANGAWFHDEDEQVECQASHLWVAFSKDDRAVY